MIIDQYSLIEHSLVLLVTAILESIKTLFHEFLAYLIGDDDLCSC